MSITKADVSPQPLHVLPSAPITAALAAFFFIIVFTGFLSLFFCRCFLKNLLLAWNLHQIPSGELVRAGDTPENPGLDPKIVASFPVLSYSLVRDRGVECSICLSDFSDEDTVRLITTCRHVFHTGCIDLWFESHKTCPFCRCDLEPDQASLEKPPVLPGINLVRSRSRESLHDAVMILVQEDIPDWNENDSIGISNQMNETHERQMQGNDRRFLRSHSTGHSIIWPRIDDAEREEETYSLRFLENVNMKITRGHNQTESCITFGELTRFDRARDQGCLGDTSTGSISGIRA